MYLYALRNLLLLLAFLCFTACGGGSGSSSSDNPGTNPQRTSQSPLTFESASLSVSILDTAPSNPLSGGSGSGGTTYSSSDSSVATVDASTGALTLIAPGSTTITATKAADSNYLSASASYELVIEKAQQEPLAFSQDVLEIFLHGAVPDNPLNGGDGEGAIVYSSSNNNVASVDSETGVVTLLTEGSAIITAIKAGDSLFNPSQATYEVIAFDVVSDLGIQVGLSNTRITWTSQHDTIETFRTSQYDCNVDNYPSCRNSWLRRFNEPSNTPYYDNFSRIGNLAYLHIQSPDYRSSPIRLEPAPVNIPFRTSHSLTAFKDRLWIIGGEAESITLDDNRTARAFRNDIWSSEDGATWKLEAENAEFAPRSDHEIIEYNNELYLFSGWVSIEGPYFRPSHEVWKSSDGVIWEQLTENALPFHIRSGEVIVFNGKLWAVSRTFGETPHNQVWSSEDGINWDLEVPFAVFPKRSAFTLYVDGGHLYMMGGFVGNSSQTPSYDVWMSPDGVQWDQVSEDGGYERFMDGKVVRLDDKLYAMGGWGTDHYETRVYTSDDARNWRVLSKADTIDLGPYFRVAVFKDLIWASNVTGPDRYMWTTSNGENWRVPVDTSDIQWQPLD